MVKKVGEKETPLGEKETPLGEKVTKVGEKVNFVAEKKIHCERQMEGKLAVCPLQLKTARLILHALLVMNAKNQIPAAVPGVLVSSSISLHAGMFKFTASES